MNIALLVIYNHRFDKNIKRIEDLYKGKFSNIFHIMPFYDGKIANVISVYDSSYRFEGYISQAYEKIKCLGFTHYFFVADDMIINPKLNENNLFELLGLNYSDCYLPNLTELPAAEGIWQRYSEALTYSPDVKGVEVKTILPSANEAANIFSRKGIKFGKLPFKTYYRNYFHWLPYSIADKIRGNNRYNYDKGLTLLGNHYNYPIVRGYSDCFVVTADIMPKFAQYCGAFAATNLFVELAIPTALCLVAECIKFDKDVKLKNGAMWNKTDFEFLEAFNHSIPSLIQNYPSNIFFLHPIKLSQWK